MGIWNRNNYPIDKIRNWAKDEKSLTWIARKLGYEIRLIHKFCKKHNIVCKKQDLGGKDHPNWKGGKIIDKDGYVFVYSPSHPFARKYFPNHILEHRLVMEKHLGRYLKRSEVVHHINGNKQDNRIENLQLFRRNADHLAYELKGRCPKWSKEGKLRILRAVRSRASNPKKLISCGI